MTADQIPIATTAIIERLRDSSLKINLMELGFLPGKTIVLLHTAPANGPMAFRLDNTLLALRKHEAALLEVKLIS